MHHIDVDQEVFDLLKRHAQPFVDSPNDVLRRLLLGEAKPSKQLRPSPQSVSSMSTQISSSVEFVDAFLATHFGNGFLRQAPYRLMFKSSDEVVYFQNFNKESTHLWYRVTEDAWKLLRQSKKPAWIVLTYPPRNFGFAIPASRIREQVERSGWTRNYLEVNIDPTSSRWVELDWNISEFKKKL